jgi:hypothetical protein
MRYGGRSTEYGTALRTYAFSSVTGLLSRYANFLNRQRYPTETMQDAPPVGEVTLSGQDAAVWPG